MQTGGKSRQIKATSKQKDIKNALKILKIIKIFKKNIIKAPKIIKNHENHQNRSEKQLRDRKIQYLRGLAASGKQEKRGNSSTQKRKT